jgi:flagellar operon protein
VIDKVFFPEPLVIPPTRKPAETKTDVPVGSASPFARILDDKLPGQGIRFSQHAQERLRSRGITLSESDLRGLAGAMDSVAKKGGKESLIMQGDTAFVVSVANRTVITAMDRKSMAGSVITNIDSAAVI